VKIRLLTSAEDDLLDAFYFYERCEAGLGEHFWDTIFAEIDSLKNLAGIHPVVRGYQRMLFKTFPFAIFYTIRDDAVEVKAVLDLRRRESHIEDRLQ